MHAYPVELFRPKSARPNHTSVAWHPPLSNPTVEKRINNNLVLKKLRIAFELRDEDMHQAFADAGMPVGKPELSAFFRQPEHRNYRACGDQLLRNFLKGLTLRLRPR